MRSFLAWWRLRHRDQGCGYWCRPCRRYHEWWDDAEALTDFIARGGSSAGRTS